VSVAEHEPESIGGLPGGVFGRPQAIRRRTWHWLHGKRVPRGRETAFVFAGGGNRGAAQVGMLRALVERGIRADAVYGVSVGALNAAGYAGDPSLAGVERLETTWRAVRRDDVFPTSKVSGLLRFLQSRESVHPNDGLRQIIENGLAFERLEHARVHFEVVATSLTDGRARWFDRGPAVEAILASAALPALLPPVEIDGERYIDGGVVDNVPIMHAISQGAERVFVLLCGPLRYTPLRYRRPVEAVLSAFFIAIHASFARSLDELPPGVEVVVFSVDSGPVPRYDDFSATAQLIEAGRRNAEAVLTFWEQGGRGEIATPAGEALVVGSSAASDGEASA
jgi:NTE family protein